MLKNFKDISVRDKNSYETVYKLTDKEPKINLDPVLISDFEETQNIKVNHNNYIILYAYTDRIQDEEAKQIRKFSEKYNKKIISIGTYQNCADIHLILNPFEMLAYIKNADFIITDTFHGTIFSIKYNKKFVSIIRKSNKEKLEDLLNRLNMNERKLEDINELEFKLMNDISYDKTNNIIKNETQKAISYLTESLVN